MIRCGKIPYDSRPYRSDAWPGVCGELGTNPVSAAWPLPDPAKFTGRAVERQVFLNELYGALLRRISVFTSLPVVSLDRMTLTRQLNSIGSAVPQAAE